MRQPIFVILAILSSAITGASLAQTASQGPSSSDPRARCAQLIAYWQLHGGAKSEGGSGADMPRKNAELDCEAGRYDRGIETMEDLLRRNGYTVPPL